MFGTDESVMIAAKVNAVIVVSDVALGSTTKETTPSLKAHASIISPLHWTKKLPFCHATIRKGS
jgi:hypothetical protein